MNILRFISWWWKKSENAEKFIATVIVAAIPAIPAAFIYGSVAFLVWLASVFALVILTGICQLVMALYNYVKKCYRRFVEEQEREAREIIERLQGRRR